MRAAASYRRRPDDANPRPGTDRQRRASALLVDAAGDDRLGLLARASTATRCSARCSTTAPPATSGGIFAVELAGLRARRAGIRRPTPRYSSRGSIDAQGSAVEITDCAPRFRQYGRMFHPMMLVRRVRRLAGSPRITVRLRPACGYGARRPAVTMRQPPHPLRDARHDAAAHHRRIDHRDPGGDGRSSSSDTVTLVLGPDETVHERRAGIGRRFIEETIAYWRDWVRRLAIPFEWQDEVIRAAITLQAQRLRRHRRDRRGDDHLDSRGAGSGRNWDYRYCWLRDAYFVVDALNRLGATDTMERYLRLHRQRRGRRRGRLRCSPSTASTARGARRGMVDVAAGLPRHGPGARRQPRLPPGAARRLRIGHPGGDARVLRRAATRARATPRCSSASRPLGRQRAALSRPARRGAVGAARHARACTPSPRVMCWAACDRLARIAERLGLPARARLWRERRRAHPAPSSASAAGTRSAARFVAALDGEALDASLLLLADLGFLSSRRSALRRHGARRSSAS